MKFKGFSYEDGRIIKVAYFDGYGFGDRMLEGVPFKAEVTKDGKLKVSFAEPDGAYEQGLNRKKWEKEALEYAETEDMFSDSIDLRGEDVALEVEKD
jgi:hypothetical protein